MKEIKDKRLTNACISIKCNKFDYIKTKEQFLEFLKRLGYCKYIIFQKEIGNETKEEHGQGYIEFNKVVRLKRVQKDLKSYDDYCIQPRKGTKTQAIMYCIKKDSRIEESIEGDEIKEKKHPGKIKKIIDDVEQQKYIDLNEIKQKNAEFNIWHEKKIDTVGEQNFIEKMKEKKESFLNSSCKVIGVFGESGAGKSVWTNNYLDNILKIERRYVSFITPESLEYNEKISFYEGDEECKVLVINEVDEEFPKHNNLILLIDRSGALKTKKNRGIENKFELIIINSLGRPEIVYKHLKKEKTLQVIRRIYNKHLGSAVIEVKANNTQLEKIKKAKEYKKFIKGYKPIINEIKEPDYSLMEKE